MKNVEANKVSGVMSRLLKNEEGNVLALFAAAVIPFFGLVGGGVDMSRIYLSQTRLQGACDAGALIGRKTMGLGKWADNGNAAKTQAEKLFDQNFPSGAYGTTGLVRSFAESNGNVKGTASVTIPMTLMRVLGQKSQAVSVSCQAELRVPNTDVMFVLDTTGSMDEPIPNSGSTEPKIDGLRKAVKCFYEALAKQNITDIQPSDCGETSDPTASNLGSVQMRFGFVPYAVNVNVGRLLPLDYMADRWTYQSREASFDTKNDFSGWTYKPVTFNVSGLKGTGKNPWQSSLQLPIGDKGANTTVNWAGCIEERQTFRAPDSDPSNDWDPIPSTALDMDIDLVPTKSNVASQWGPMLPSAIWQRYNFTTFWGIRVRSTRSLENISVAANSSDTMPTVADSCPTAARTFQTWEASDFSKYVNDLTTGGSTYHDIGLLWGARIMSPTGIFAELNAPKNMTIERHMVFMTDGDTQTNEDDYSAYGVHWYDRRQTPTGSAPTSSLLEKLTDARTVALCEAIKNKNINLWVVSYGSVSGTTSDRLRACATPGKFVQASSVASLISNFKEIAAKISALRLTK
ncbi:Flp pilus assembly protein TadG [Sphingorhabdus rigui]|uniref:Flp pilus assembly protein TadG n=2 Tax=Sphingorhabdus rigui TaxID=1282858 RepID=A0A840AX14_9SPHN|nr:Flp pilus assembly protein TadG [Sphingorhabdus rigui]